MPGGSAAARRNIQPREELFSIAPTTVPSKTHYGLEGFESRWAGGMQMKLFQALSR